MPPSNVPGRDPGSCAPCVRSVFLAVTLLAPAAIPGGEVRAGEPSAAVDIAKALGQRVIDPALPLREVRAYTQSRVPVLRPPTGLEAWDLQAETLRRAVLERIVLRGEGTTWNAAPSRVVWSDTLSGGPGYRIRKLRYEALPGLWIPALLYEPVPLSGKRPVVLNVNGHDGNGKAAVYKQIRCINQAKRGMLALNVEWLGMGQLRAPGFVHYRMNQLDLCGTSGLAPFYLAMKRGIDLLLSLPHADPERLAVAGLSGGGWQTIFISALDTRVALANPVAGYGSYLTRAIYPADLGDSEQTPTDLATLADFTHFTALLAPRPALLTFNAKDDCCFKAAHTLPPLVAAARPVYALYGRADVLRTHVNHDPGTHNFERENREALYAALVDFFLSEQTDVPREEIPCADEVKGREQLDVALPADNADFHKLALALSRELPRGAECPTEPEAAAAWRTSQTALLRDIVRSRRFTVRAMPKGTEKLPGGSITRWTLGCDDTWTLPATELAPDVSPDVVILVADAGRASVGAEAERIYREGKRVLAVDPFFLGESKISTRDVLFALLLACVGDRPLGLQASQLAAVARWLKSSRGASKVTIRAHGPRTSLAALVAATLDGTAIDGLELRDSLKSLRDIIARDMIVTQAPEFFCFGLLERFDISRLAALVAPRPVRFLAPDTP